MLRKSAQEATLLAKPPGAALLLNPCSTQSASTSLKTKRKRYLYKLILMTL